MINKKVLWLVTELFYPEETSTAYIMTQIAEKLAISRDVKVICGPVDYQKSEIKAKHELSSNIQVFRTRTLALDKNNLVFRLFRIILLSIQLSIKLFLKAKRGEEVLLVTNPALIVIGASFVGRLKGLKLSMIVHDVFPENLEAANIIERKSVGFRVLRKLFNNAYRNSDQLFVLGRDMAEVIESKLNSYKYKPDITVIENWADTEAIFPLSKRGNPILSEAKIEDKIIFQFAGNFGRLQGLMELLQIIYRIKNPLIHFVFIGEGALKQEIIEYISKNSLKNVTVLPSFSRDQQQHFLNAADVGIVSLAPKMYGLGVPSKAYNILAAGKPILFIGPKGSEIYNVIKDHDIGWCYEPIDHEGLISFFEEFDAGVSLRAIEKGHRARLVVSEFFSKPIILNKIEKALMKKM